jgi:hypothetical protein
MRCILSAVLPTRTPAETTLAPRYRENLPESWAAVERSRPALEAFVRQVLNNLLEYLTLRGLLATSWEAA